MLGSWSVPRVSWVQRQSPGLPGFEASLQGRGFEASPQCWLGLRPVPRVAGFWASHQGCLGSRSVLGGDVIGVYKALWHSYKARLGQLSPTRVCILIG